MDTVAFYTGAGIFFATALALAVTSAVRFRDNYDALLLVFITTVAATCYLAMAQGLGQAGNVQVVRYLDWVITTPLLLYTLVTLLVPSLPTSILLVAVLFIDVYMIVTGLVAALEPGDARWGWFALSGLALVVLTALLFGPIYKYARRSKMLGSYRMLATYLVAIWFVYPVVWILSPVGVGVISSDLETVLYLVLDVLAKSVFSVLVLTALVKANRLRRGARA